MDAVRFGRALGFGARQAAKTVIRAVDAARAENPSQPAPSATASGTPAAPAAAPRTSVVAQPPPVQRRSQAVDSEIVSRGVRDTAERTAAQARGVQEGISRFKTSAIEPVVRLSGVLWLEVMGVFFGIFAFSTAIAVWRLRAEWRAAFAHPAEHGSLLAAAAVCALFAYFCISSFVRARRRERRRG